jgi:hypothetical protein
LKIQPSLFGIAGSLHQGRAGYYSLPHASIILGLLVRTVTPTSAASSLSAEHMPNRQSTSVPSRPAPASRHPGVDPERKPDWLQSVCISSLAAGTYFVMHSRAASAKG